MQQVTDYEDPGQGVGRPSWARPGQGPPTAGTLQGDNKAPSTPLLNFDFDSFCDLDLDLEGPARQLKLPLYKSKAPMNVSLYHCGMLFHVICGTEKAKTKATPLSMENWCDIGQCHESM